VNIEWSRRLAPVLLLVVAGLLLSACTTTIVGPSGEQVEGSGNVVEEERDVSGFSAVNLAGVGELLIEQGTEERLVVEADDNIQPMIITQVRNGTLEIGLNGNISLQTATRLTYRLTVYSLDELIVSGAGSVRVNGIESDRLRFRLTGAGDLRASGVVPEQQIIVSGAGTFDGSELSGEDVTVTISGLGNAVVSASNTLDATISGAGSVEYIGNPDIQQEINGLGSISQRAEAE
jgi:predicted small secreted protein